MQTVARPDPRRAELADFLRNRRAALAPEDVGLPPTARRRTPGLRREEVAELAGVSVALYAWLEQSREIPVSRRAIDAIASALQLSPGERAHVQHLALRESAPLDETITPQLRRFVASMRSQPTFVLDHAWDTVLRNDAAVVVFGGPVDPDPEKPSNMIEHIFTDPRFNELWVEHDQVKNSVVSMFRMDYALHAEDPHAQSLVERLRATIPEFEAIWQRQCVQDAPRGARELRHATVGKLVLEPALFSVVESPGLRIMTFTPFDGETAHKIDLLMSDYSRREPVRTPPSTVTTVPVQYAPAREAR